jgi:FAD-NAD(P)-binding
MPMPGSLVRLYPARLGGYPARRRTRVLVIGGRATGAAVVVHLAEELPAGSTVVVVDPEDADYPAVFDDNDKLVVANTSPQINSLFPDRPGDFVSYLRSVCPQASVREVTSRTTVGGYYRLRYAQAVHTAHLRGVEVRRVQATCDAVIGGDGDYEAVLSTGDRLRVTDVVVAVGVGKARAVDGIPGIPPFPTRRLRTSPQPENVLVLGQGQSAIDAALVLSDAGSRVVMASRSGTFPAVRTRTLPYPVNVGRVDAPADVYALTDRDTRGKGHPPLAAQLCRLPDPVDRLRAETQLAEMDACPWQDSVVGILDLLCERALPLARDRGFAWRYFTAIALVTAQRLLRDIEAGKIVVRPLPEVDHNDFDLVVTATGFHPPPLYYQGRTLLLGNPGGAAEMLTTVDSDLRMVLGAGRPERIWAVGPASGVRVPFANFLRGATRQAQNVARQIGTLAVRQEVVISTNPWKSRGPAVGAARQGVAAASSSADGRPW